MNNKREQGLLIAALTCVAGLIFLLVIFYFNKMAGLDF